MKLINLHQEDVLLTESFFIMFCGALVASFFGTNIGSRVTSLDASIPVTYFWVPFGIGLMCISSLYARRYQDDWQHWALRKSSILLSFLFFILISFFSKFWLEAGLYVYSTITIGFGLGNLLPGKILKPKSEANQKPQASAIEQLKGMWLVIHGMISILSIPWLPFFVLKELLFLRESSLTLLLLLSLAYIVWGFLYGGYREKDDFQRVIGCIAVFSVFNLPVMMLFGFMPLLAIAIGILLRRNWPRIISRFKPSH